MEENTQDMPKTETFGQRLIRLRTAAGHPSPSDLARAMWGEKPDSRGFVVANNRDTIWRWEHDKGLPSRKNLSKLAEILNCKPEDLDPDRGPALAPRAAPITKPVMQLTTLPDGRYRLSFSGAVDLKPVDALQLLKDLEGWWEKSNLFVSFAAGDEGKVAAVDAMLEGQGFERAKKPTSRAKSRRELIAPTATLPGTPSHVEPETLPNPLTRRNV